MVNMFYVTLQFPSRQSAGAGASSLLLRLTAGDRSGSRFVAERRGYADDVWCMVFKEVGETPCCIACVPDVAPSANASTLITSVSEKFERRITHAALVSRCLLFWHMLTVTEH